MIAWHWLLPTSIFFFCSGAIYGLWVAKRPIIEKDLNAADPKAPKMNSPQVFYNWRRNGFPGFDQPETDE